MTENIQIALAIGNSRYHWAWFIDAQIQSSWDTSYLTPARIALLVALHSLEQDYFSYSLFPIELQAIIKKSPRSFNQIPLYLLSVVPLQTKVWQNSRPIQLITLTDVPLFDLYPTLGIDRAVAFYGAGETYGYPVLVIDGGTALTITGVDDRRHLVGGAIMPGLQLQFNSLSTGTAALPAVELPQKLPPRWSQTTEGAIASGVVHTLNAGIRDYILDWHQLFPHSKIILTGGDRQILSEYLRPSLPPQLTDLILCDRHLLMRGIERIIVHQS
jgi:type III pantothenate kinase